MSKQTIIPILSVRRGAAAVEFYKTAFGAEELFLLTGESGDVFAQLSAGGAEFWVSDEAPAYGNYSPESAGGGTVRMVLVVDDPDAVFARAVSAGAAAVHPVEDQHGWRFGRVADPFGHHWEIGKKLS